MKYLGTQQSPTQQETRFHMESDPRSWSSVDVESYLDNLFAADDPQRKECRRMNVRHAAVNGRFLLETVVTDEALMSSELQLSKLQARRLAADLGERAAISEFKTPQPIRTISSASTGKTPATPEMEEMRKRLAQLELVLQMTVKKPSSRKSVRHSGEEVVALPRDAEENASTADVSVEGSPRGTPERRRVFVPEVEEQLPTAHGELEDLEDRLHRLQHIAALRASRATLQDQQLSSTRSVLRENRSPARVGLGNGSDASLWVVGGWDGRVATGSVERYDVQAKRWTRSNSLQTGRRGACLAVAQSVVYVMGGWDGRQHLRSVDAVALDRVDARPGPSWMPLPPLPHAASDAAAAACGSEVWLLGGCVSAPSPRVQVLRLPGRVWETGPELNTARSRLAAVGLGGFVFAIGGNDGARVLSSVERLDTRCPEQGWKRVGCLSCPRESHGAEAIKGRIYVAGGHDGQQHLSSVEVLEGLGGSWRIVTCMQVPRSSFALVAHGDALVAIGGNTSCSRIPLGSVEVWSPGKVPTDRWTFVSELCVPRVAFVAFAA